MSKALLKSTNLSEDAELSKLAKGYKQKFVRTVGTRLPRTHQAPSKHTLGVKWHETRVQSPKATLSRGVITGAYYP